MAISIERQILIERKLIIERKIQGLLRQFRHLPKTFCASGKEEVNKTLTGKGILTGERKRRRVRQWRQFLADWTVIYFLLKSASQIGLPLNCLLYT